MYIFRVCAFSFTFDNCSRRLISDSQYVLLMFILGWYETVFVCSPSGLQSFIFWGSCLLIILGD
jgi:hypothetical protein